MDIETLRIFAEVAHRGSFSEVARSRSTEPSSISRAVGVIEAELGERLFHRTTRKLSLTEAGALYLARIEPLVAQLEEAGAEARAIGRGPVGTLRLSVSVSYGMVRVMPMLARFRARPHPAERAQASVDGESIGAATILSDVVYQAQTLGGTVMEGIREGKAVFKRSTRISGVLLLDDALRTNPDPNQLEGAAGDAWRVVEPLFEACAADATA